MGAAAAFLCSERAGVHHRRRPAGRRRDDPGGLSDAPAADGAGASRSPSPRWPLTTALIYPLAEAVPVVSTGVVYLIAVLLVSSYWGLWLGLLTGAARRRRLELLPPAADRRVHDRRRRELGRARSSSWSPRSSRARSPSAARSRAEEAERGRREADLTAEMARLLLGGASEEQPLRTVGQRIAQAYDLASVSVELSWVDSDSRRRALPLIVEGSRIGTVLVPADTDERDPRRAPGPRGARPRDARRRRPSPQRARGAGDRDEGAAPQQRGQDDAAA